MADSSGKRAVIVFRNRLDGESSDVEYGLTAAKMLEKVRTMPGFVSFDAFESGDGERLSLIEFETVEQARAWGREAEHLDAQRRGREVFYTEYSLQVCELVRESRFTAWA